MNETRKNQILRLAKQSGIIRARDVAQLGIPHTYLTRLMQGGQLQRIGRGLYMLPHVPITENHTLVEACKRVPTGVICLLSALRFHRLTTLAPFEIWLAIENKAWKPQLEDLPLRFVYFSDSAFSEGV